MPNLTYPNANVIAQGSLTPAVIAGTNQIQYLGNFPQFVRGTNLFYPPIPNAQTAGDTSGQVFRLPGENITHRSTVGVSTGSFSFSGPKTDLLRIRRIQRVVPRRRVSPLLPVNKQIGVDAFTQFYARPRRRKLAYIAALTGG